MAEATDKLMNEKDLATRWGVTTKTLQLWRAEGIGPNFSVLGKNTVRYRIEDVLAYEEERLQQKTNQPEGTDQ